MQDTYLWVLPVNLVGEFARPVRRVVINDQYVRGRRMRSYLLEQRAQVVVFVIRRNNDKRFHFCVSPEFDNAAAVCKSGRLSGASKLLAASACICSSSP